MEGPPFSHSSVWQNTDLYLGRSDVKQRGAAPVGIVRFIILVKVIIHFQISERPRGVRRLRGWGQGFGAFGLHLTASVWKTMLHRCSWMLTSVPTTKSTLRRSHCSLQINPTPIIVQRPLFYYDLWSLLFCWFGGDLSSNVSVSLCTKTNTTRNPLQKL